MRALARAGLVLTSEICALAGAEYKLASKLRVHARLGQQLTSTMRARARLVSGSFTLLLICTVSGVGLNGELNVCSHS